MEKPLSVAEWIVHRGASWVAFIGGIGIYLISAAIVVDVLMRWLFNAPILGVDDISIYVLAVVITSFFPAGLAEERFVTIRFLGKALGHKGTYILEVFGAICTLVFFILISWKMLIYAVDVSRSGLATIVLQLPQAPWWWVVAVLLLICILVQGIIMWQKLSYTIGVTDRE
jgi:TRAP-type transport system small permease protein